MRPLTFVTTITLLCLSARAAPLPPAPLGRWVTASGNLEVEIAPCGTALCGTGTQVLGNRSMSPNQNAPMQPVDTRSAVGMKILVDFLPDADEPGQWHGQIYNRENGKTYRCRMSLGQAGELVLRPYVGLPLFGQTQIWRAVVQP